MFKRLVPTLAAALLVAGCAAANKPTASSVSTSSASAGSGSMANMVMTNTSGSSSSASAARSEAAAAGMSVDGIKAVPMRVLGSSDWQGMKITAQLMTAVPFVVYDGTSEHLVKPTSKTSFHLMVMLNDAHTGVPIPYAGVWATIVRRGQVVYDERQWPMISEYMGPHYGNDVSLPGAGNYRLSLLISPPVSARHVEYEHVWLSPHRVSLSFHWIPPA
jgi:uncharacterized protein involved in high-affinity Fe2+ transport